MRDGNRHHAPANAALDDARDRARRTYNCASDAYDDPANSFWSRFGEATVARLGLRPGDRVLDVCCGSGASALPAAERVGPTGFVLGVDLAERMLELARRKAHARGLKHCEFRVGDLLALNDDGRGGDPVRGHADGFDAVVCVFGVFFVPDVAAAVRSLWAQVRPGGQLAITTWGPRFFEPATSAFWDSIRAVRPDLHKSFNPWDRICDPPSLYAVMREGGVPDAEIVAVSSAHPIDSPQAWWWAVLGSGYRGTIEQLDADARHRVMTANFEYVARTGLSAVEANVVYAVARRAPPR